MGELAMALKSARSNRVILLLAGIGLMVIMASPAPAPAAETLTFIHTDALGSPVAATDQQGNVIWREEYKPYGERLKNEVAAQTNTRWFTGHPHDAATGLTYMGARYYDAVVGRFMGVDPAAFSEKNPHSFNRFAYGSNNPYRNLDPDGRWSTDAHNHFIRIAFAGMSDKVLSYMMAGSLRADRNQITGSHIHSMWSIGGGRLEMIKLRAEYITDRLNSFSANMTKFNDALAAGNNEMAAYYEREAWMNYGEALHPVMDSTSPSHNTKWNPLDITTAWNEHGNASPEDLDHARGCPKFCVNGRSLIGPASGLRRES